MDRCALRVKGRGRVFVMRVFVIRLFAMLLFALQLFAMRQLMSGAR